MPKNYFIKKLCQIVVLIQKKTWSILNNIIKGSTFSNYLNTTLSADDFNLYLIMLDKIFLRILILTLVLIQIYMYIIYLLITQILFILHKLQIPKYLI